MSSLRYTIRKGLDLPITGEPEQRVEAGPQVQHVAILGQDFVGMKPTMQVQAGDRVRKGQVLFEDKKTPGVLFTAPVAGEVVGVNRGAKRVFESVVIRAEGDEEETFTVPSGDLRAASRETIRDVMVNSGQWTMLRTRPFSRVPSPDSTPAAIFVNAMDSNPLAASPGKVLDGREEDFARGLIGLSKLTDGKVFLCFRPGEVIPCYDLPEVTAAHFEGPHPSGLVGTHIHFLMPVSAERTVWHANYQDVAALGALLATGRLDTERIVSLAGPAAKKPRLVKTTVGAKLSELLAGEVEEGPRGTRRISGSVFNGRHCEKDDADTLGFLGRYHLQVSLLKEGGERELIGWHMPGGNKFSLRNAFTAAIPRAIRNAMKKMPPDVAPPLPPEQKFAFDTSANGSPRAMVPIGMYEDVMPLDIIPTFLLRSLVTRDTDSAQALGALELDEEDLGLCTFVCPGKTEYQSLLRENLATIEREG